MTSTPRSQALRDHPVTPVRLAEKSTTFPDGVHPFIESMSEKYRFPKRTAPHMSVDEPDPVDYKRPFLPRVPFFLER
ncbi:MAG: hypothetical protein H7839_23545 [Magnetococcus sp. YQC-5]